MTPTDINTICAGANMDRSANPWSVGAGPPVTAILVRTVEDPVTHLLAWDAYRLNGTPALKGVFYIRTATDSSVTPRGGA